MRLKQLLLYSLLFFGFDIVKAQFKTEQDTAKVYEKDEIVVNEYDQETDIKELRLKEQGIINSLYLGDPVKALQANAFIQTYSPLVSSFYIDGLPVNEFSGFYIGNIPILGSPWEQEWESISLSTKLGSRLFSNLQVINTNYSAKYDALSGLVKVDLADFNERTIGGQGSATLLNFYLSPNFSIEDIGSFVFYYDNKKPIWPLNNIPETRFIPHTHSLQALLQSNILDGELSLAAFKFYQDASLIEESEEDSLTLNQDSNHDLGILTYSHDFFNYNSILSFGCEYWNQNANVDINYLNNKIDLGTRAYTLNFEIKEKNTANALGIIFSSIKYNSLNDLINNGLIADSLFYEALTYIEPDISPELKEEIIAEYNNIPLEDRLLRLQEMVDVTSEIYSQHTGESPEDYEWFNDYKNKLYDPLNQNLSEDYSRSVDLIKIYWDQNYFIKNLLQREILLTTSLAINKLRSQDEIIGGANITYSQGILSFSLGYNHQVSYFERGNISRIFQERVDKRTSDAYSLAVRTRLEHDLLDNATIETYFKEYNTTSYGKSYGINFSFVKDDRFSYQLTSSVGRSQFDNNPLVRSVDKTLTLLTSYNIFQNWLAFFKFTIQDGYWTDKTISGKPEKLGTSKNLDLGTTVIFSIFKDDDTSVSTGLYYPIKSPLFNYTGSSGNLITQYAPPVFTLNFTFTR